MAYLGRVVGAGLNERDRPYAVYAVSGRSEPSRMRIVEITDDFTVCIGPSGYELTREQDMKKDLLFYDVMSVMPESKVLVTSNGKQTDSIKGTIRKRGSRKDYHLAICEGCGSIGGAALDKSATPRICPRVAGVVDDTSAALGIVNEKGIISSYLPVLLPKLQYVSAYKGDPSDKTKIIFSELRIPSGDYGLSGNTAQDLADNMYDWMDKDLVVCSAAALWNPDSMRWELAVRNLHE